jgi:SAM-dependent methyltransferase
MKMSLHPVGRILTSYTATAFPSVFPYSQRDLVPHDNAPASEFYTHSRLVNHIDDHAIQNLQRFYGNALPSNASIGPAASVRIAKVLDICSSWVSHIPYTTDSQPSISPRNQVIGIGMNAKELEANGILSHWIVHDLDKDPDFRQALKHAHKGKTYDAIQRLQGTAAGKEDVTAEGPYDAVICNVSIDYLSRPLEVMEQVGRNLKPGAWAYMAISNRCFPTKVAVLYICSGFFILLIPSDTGCTPMAEPLDH